ncbi:HlyD family efflux transporter periplasmic adaptor subunit [Lactobacillus intestinalis]|uniref:HlyD family efflux transporter periplasmic adaptor subunit n=1 Tax=Lactobacillus intestinalis TaxID=151781 RepID=UPI0026EF48CB|nr:HlyD family efflux transporter periplasmic adaptor subunit [Lactobacillus intestinalis]
MDKKYLESSEFYAQRFNNFSTMIIIPIFVLFIGVILFSFFGKREIDINSVGVIEPKKIVANIQTSVNGKITYSSLNEGEKVNKGQILLKYSNAENDNKLSLYNDQKQLLEEQISDLYLVRRGINTNSDVFEANDQFGYRDSLKGYLEQRKTYLLEANNTSNKEKKYNNQKLELMQLEELQKNATALVKAKTQLKQLQNSINSIKIENKEYTIKSPKTGILHINDQYQGNKYINPGIEVAQIYPEIKKQTSVKINTYIPATDISSVKKGQKLRFRITKNLSKPIILIGKINNISVSSINSNKGDFYRVSALAKINSREKDELKYGMDGNISIITGKITFFDYYKNKIFGNE